MKILITGLPKTGTTALVQYLVNSLPGKVDVQFEPCRYREPARAVDHVVAKVLFQGTRVPVDLDSFAGFDHAFLLVRDPRDTLISEHLYKLYNTPWAEEPRSVKPYLERLRRKEAEPAAVSFMDLQVALFRILHEQPYAERDPAFIRDILASHRAFFVERPLEFIDRHPAFKIVKYEAMVAGSFEAIERDTGLSINQDIRRDRRVTPALKRVGRTRTSGDWKNWFLPEDVHSYAPVLNPFLERVGYDMDWVLPTDPRIPSEHGSGYVESLIAEKKRSATRGSWLTRLFSPKGIR